MKESLSLDSKIPGWDGAKHFDNYYKYQFRCTMGLVKAIFMNRFSNFEMYLHNEGEVCEAYFYIGDSYIKINYVMKDSIFRSADSYINEIAAKFLQKS